MEPRDFILACVMAEHHDVADIQRTLANRFQTLSQKKIREFLVGLEEEGKVKNVSERWFLKDDDVQAPASMCVDLEEEICKLLRMASPLKASQMLKDLRELSEDLTKTDVNKILYKMKRQGKASVDESHAWQLI